MKPLFTSWKLPILIGILTVVALLINAFFFNKATVRREAKAQEQRQVAAAAEAKQTEQATKAQSEEQRKKAIEDAAAEHNHFLARYLNPSFTRKEGIATIGIAIESEQGTMNSAIANAFAQRFTSSGIQLHSSFFKPEFVADKFVSSVFSGNTAIFERLELTNSLNGVLIGRQTITYSTNAALENTVTANLRLEVMALPVGSTRQSQSWAFSANGVGFNNFDARNQAEDRVIHQIASDSKLSLSEFNTSK